MRQLIPHIIRFSPATKKAICTISTLYVLYRAWVATHCHYWVSRSRRSHVFSDPANFLSALCFQTQKSTAVCSGPCEADFAATGSHNQSHNRRRTDRIDMTGHTRRHVHKHRSAPHLAHSFGMAASALRKTETSASVSSRPTLKRMRFASTPNEAA